MNLQTLRERRSSTLAAMRAITEAASREDRDFTDDEKRSFDEKKAALSKLDEQLDRATYLADQERRMQTDPASRGRGDNFERACGDFKIMNAVRAQIDARSVDCGLEIEVSQEIARRSGRSPRGIFIPYSVYGGEKRDILTTNTGGNTVPNPLRAEMFIEPLRVAPVVAKAGALVLDGLVGDVDIPRQTATGSLSTVAEHGAVSETSQTFDQVSLRPRTIGAYTEVSRRWLVNSTPAGERIVRNDLTAAINTKVDEYALVGNPSATSPNNLQPTGVLYTSGINAVAFGGAPSWDKIQLMVASVAADNAEQGALSFIANASTRGEILKTLMASSTDSRHLTENPNELAGYALRMSNHLPGNAFSSPVVNGTMLYGNWNDLILGFWSGVDLLVNPYHSDVFAKGGALISAFLDFDVKVRHAESFCSGTGITIND